jgi:hypothetical protein
LRPEEQTNRIQNSYSSLDYQLVEALNMSTPPDTAIEMNGVDMNDVDSNGDASPESCGEFASIWKRYMERAEHDDKGLVKIVSNDLDALLLFVSPALCSDEYLLMYPSSGYFVLGNTYGFSY